MTRTSRYGDPRCDYRFTHFYVYIRGRPAYFEPRSRRQPARCNAINSNGLITRRIYKSIQIPPTLFGGRVSDVKRCAARAHKLFRPQLRSAVQRSLLYRGLSLTGQTSGNRRVGEPTNLEVSADTRNTEYGNRAVPNAGSAVVRFEAKRERERAGGGRRAHPKATCSPRRSPGSASDRADTPGPGGPPPRYRSSGPRRRRPESRARPRSGSRS